MVVRPPFDPAQQLRRIAYQLTQLPHTGTAGEQQIVRELDRLALRLELKDEDWPADLFDTALELRQAERLRYQELFDFAPDGYVITDLQGLIIEANYAAAALFQTPREFLTGKPFPSFIEQSCRHEIYQRLALLNCRMAVQP